jgi:hypothetical protein
MKKRGFEFTEIITCNLAEQALACAELIVESKDTFAIRRQKVDEMKAIVRRAAQHSRNGLLPTAVWCMAHIEDKVHQRKETLTRNHANTGEAKMDS